MCGVCTVWGYGGCRGWGVCICVVHVCVSVCGVYARVSGVYDMCMVCVGVRVVCVGVCVWCGVCGGVCMWVCVVGVGSCVCVFGGQPEQTWGAVSAQENWAQSGCGRGDEGPGTLPPAWVIGGQRSSGVKTRELGGV